MGRCSGPAARAAPSLAVRPRPCALCAWRPQDERSGAERQAFVPFFDMANHAPAAPTYHAFSTHAPLQQQQDQQGEAAGPSIRCVAVDGASGGDGAGAGSFSMLAVQLPQGPGQQVFIDYGNKTNRWGCSTSAVHTCSTHLTYSMHVPARAFAPGGGGICPSGLPAQCMNACMQAAR